MYRPLGSYEDHDKLKITGNFYLSYGIRVLFLEVSNMILFVSKKNKNKEDAEDIPK